MNPIAPQPLLGLKFIFRNGMFFIAVLPEIDARACVQNWAKGLYKGKPITDSTNSWAVHGDDITAVHLVSMEQLQQQAQQPQGGTQSSPMGLWHKSGNN